MCIYRIVAVAGISLAALIDSAFAGTIAAPGPIAGIGLPALAILGGAYWVGRKIFARRK